MTSGRLQFLSSRLHFEIGSSHAYHFFLASARSVAATNLASDDDDTNVHSGKEDFDPRRGIWRERNGRGRQSEAAVGADGCDV